jgi:fumarate hydratase class II
VQGCDVAVNMAGQAGQLELNVMMPIIAHNLFEMMQVMIGSIGAFTDRCAASVVANAEKAEGWLEKNAIVVTALNPVIGYSAGAKLVKEALATDRTVRQVAIEKAEAGELAHREDDREVEPDEIKAALDDLRALTEGGIAK